MTAAVAVLYWATLHFVLAAVLLGWSQDALTIALLAGSGAAGFALGLALLGYKGTDRVRSVPELSLAPILLGFGIAVALTGWAFGRWLIIVGGAAAAVGLARLSVEVLLERRSA